jgi:hypothetical protein
MSINPQCSIVVSAPASRLNLFRRTLYSIAVNPPSIPFELVCVDDTTDDSKYQAVKQEFHQYKDIFHTTHIRVNNDLFHAETGLRHYCNSSVISANLGVAYANSTTIFLQGNEVLALGRIYDNMLAKVPLHNNYLILSTTIDLPQSILDKLDIYGTNLDREHIEPYLNRTLASTIYHSDVNNYCSAFSRQIWNMVGGLNVRFCEGIGCEDSCIVRRFRKITDFQLIRCGYDCLSAHQSHGGVTKFGPQTTYDDSFWNEGIRRNRSIYDSWDGSIHSGNTYNINAGVVEVDIIQ